MGICKGNIYRKFTGAIYIEGNGIRVDFFIGIWKPLCKDGVQYVIYLFYADFVWIFNDVYIEIGEFLNLLECHR